MISIPRNVREVNTGSLTSPFKMNTIKETGLFFLKPKSLRMKKYLTHGDLIAITMRVSIFILAGIFFSGLLAFFLVLWNVSFKSCSVVGFSFSAIVSIFISIISDKVLVYGWHYLFLKRVYVMKDGKRVKEISSKNPTKKREQQAMRATITAYSQNINHTAWIFD